jgi:hypothetical protein
MGVIKNRLSVVERLYFQDHINRASPVDYGDKFSINLESDEQPYQRDNKVGEDWTKLDFGWLSSLQGMFEVTNNDKVTGLELAYCVPTEGSTIALESLVAVNEVYPLASQRCALAANVEAYIRSKAGTVKYSLIAFPK